MNFDDNMSAASAFRSLHDLCQLVATEAEWTTYCALSHVNRDALRKRFPDDLSECAPGAATISYEDREYIDADAAHKFLLKEEMESLLVDKALSFALSRHWKAEARRPGAVQFLTVDICMLINIFLRPKSMNFYVEGERYLDLRFSQIVADYSIDFETAVSSIAKNMDPSVHNVSDIKVFIEEALGRVVSLKSVKEALKSAGLHAWSKPGRKRLSPSHPNTD